MRRFFFAFLALLLMTALPITALAADSITVSLSTTKAEVWNEITVSGTATADVWITLEGTNADGNILYFSAVLSDSTGNYSKTLKVPDMDDGPLTITVGNGSLTATTKIAVYTPYSGGGSSGDGGSSSRSQSGSDSSAASKISVTFDSVAQAEINKKTNGNYTVKLEEVSVQSLSDKAKALIGSRPIYNLSVISGDTTLSYFGGGKASVSIPYTPADGEDANCIIIYYISASGELVTVPNCVYDAKTGAVTFTTTHFSAYAVGYNAVSFTDVADTTWYGGYVAFLSARGIISGTGNGVFSPNASITRAEFVTILVRMSGDDLSGYKSSSFSDVSTSNWYFAAVQWAYKNGIASGWDGKFNPNASITREQMAAMLYRYAEYAGNKSNTEGVSARKFNDYDSISIWAQAPVQWSLNNSIITGNPDGSFAPLTSATRAQAAKMIALLLKGIIEG